MNKWLKKNWILISGVLIIIALVWNRGCINADYKRDIQESDDKISGLEKKNEKLEDIAFESAETAAEWEKRSKEKEDLFIARGFEIRKLKEDLKKIPAIIAVLPPTELVAETQEILDCTEIELTDQGILFSEDCARTALTELTKFSLVKRERGMTEKSLFDCQDALAFQKQATFNVYRIALSQGYQIMNYKEIGEEKDLKFSLCQKQKRKAWLDGIWKGFLIGVGVTVVFSLVRGLI